MFGIVKCHYCGKEVYLPFKCPYCGHYFCSEHRLPENHACPEIWRAKAPKKEIVRGTMQESTYSYPVTYQTQVSRTKMISFSLTEIKHIAIGVLLVFMVGMSFGLPDYTLLLLKPEMLATLGLILSTSFILHELAHKIVAQLQGLWAEFRIMLFGALLTILSIFTYFFKIISPGAVVIAGISTLEKTGKISLAGPLTNILIAVVLSPFVSLLPPSSYLGFIVINTAWINSFIALFNLIPFGILDGFKIFLWDKKVWMITFAVALILTFYTGSFVFR